MLAEEMQDLRERARAIIPVCLHECPKIFVLQVVEDLPNFFVPVDAKAVSVPTKTAEVLDKREGRSALRTLGAIMNSFLRA